MANSPRKVGEFCWFNLMTPETAKAREFFSKIFRWTYDVIPNVGHIAKVGASQVGGLFDVHNPQTKQNIEPMIGVMVRVDDAGATAKKVNALGGKAQSPFEVMDAGGMAVCEDPTGAKFDLWQPHKQPGTSVDASLHGAPSWCELRTSDGDRAARFYSNLFAWVPEAKQMPGHPCTIFRLEGAMVAGMMGISDKIPEMRGKKPHWQLFFTVDDADRTVKEATGLGAKVQMPPTDIPTIGRFAAFHSPQGVPVFVIKYA